MVEMTTCPRCDGKGSIEVHFGSQLKILRKKNKMSQLELAAIVDIARPRLGNFEAGHREPNIKEIKALAKCFNVSSDYLLGVKR